MTWIVARTAVHCEQRAVTDLTRRGIVCYLPTYRVERKPRRAPDWRIIERPLFPRYLFAQPRPDLGVYGIREADGIEAVLYSVQYLAPLIVPDDVVAEIRERQDAGLFDQMRPRADKFEKGQRVRVADGPFAGLTATVMRQLSQSTVRVIMDIFGREVEASVKVEKLRKAS